ncbi:MAG: vWA domain-containing protein, partial [Terriglobales bacterium]
VINDIMPSIMGNELGIATYCGEGFDQADLTTDYKSLRWIMLNWMQVGAAPGGGSDYAEGLKEALTIFQNSPAANKQNVIVWFTDGGFTGDPQELNKVIDQVQQAGIKVIIVGVGSDTPQPIPVYSPTGQNTGFMQKDGKVVTTAIDEGALNALSSRMGAKYIRLIPGQKLDIQWASTLAGGHTEKHETQIFQYPLGLAAVLLFGLFIRGILPANRRRNDAS